jgi:hypothetical protein
MCFAHTCSGPLPKEMLQIDHVFCTYKQWPIAKGNVANWSCVLHIHPVAHCQKKIHLQLIMCFAHTCCDPLPKEMLQIDHVFCTYIQWPIAKRKCCNCSCVLHIHAVPIAKWNVAIDHDVFASLQKDLQIASYRAYNKNLEWQAFEANRIRVMKLLPWFDCLGQTKLITVEI